MLPPPRLHQPLRRVVVTGLGCASPLGGTAAESWRRAASGESAAKEFNIDGASFVAARCGDLALDEKREKARVVARARRRGSRRPRTVVRRNFRPHLRRRRPLPACELDADD